MKKKYYALIVFIIILLIFSIQAVVNVYNNDSLEYNQQPLDYSEYLNLDFYQNSDYYQYKNDKQNILPLNQYIHISAVSYSSFEGDITVLNSFQGEVNVLQTEAESSVTWEFQVDEEGFYNIRVNYYPIEGKSSSIEREVQINGEVPFEGAQSGVFNRFWGNENDIIQDINGNDIRPSQVEKPDWSSTILKDSTGYINEPYQFYFNEGLNTITLTGLREPMAIQSIEVMSVVEYATYEEVIGNDLDSLSNNLFIKVEGENHSFSSSPTLFPLSDRTSALTSPNSPNEIRLNTIGGNNWRVVGDYIVWDFKVEEAGYYQISTRVKQSLASGMNVYRNIYIDGEIPFEEFQNFAFVHSNDWRMQTLGTKEEAYHIYLEEGPHELKMEVSLGAYGPLIGQIQDSINDLNRLYREILIYTGPEPDPFRDYQLTDRIDNLVERLEEEYDNLSRIREEIVELSGSRSEKTGILDTVLLQLEDFIETPREIHKKLLAYNSNISSLGTLVLLLSAQPLEIDYILIHGDDYALPEANENMFQSTWFGFRSFIATFRNDYSNIGQTEEFETTETIEVWLSIGRDQANVLRKLIDESFTAQTGIKVELKLVNSETLLPATLANVGPDVAMGLGNSIPVNYAMRTAAYDISQFEDFDTVTDRFYDSAMVPFEFEGGYYALPEQQIFLMMFYRTDIFEELGLTPPETWDDVIALIPDLQKHNLEFYLPVPITQGSVMNLPPNPVYSTLFYQNDGEFYLDGGSESGFNEGAGPEVFEMWTSFYTDYSFPVEANFVNRFRSGQMPIGITYYNTYNTLSVFAPEIRGKWDFIPVPGTIAYDDQNNQYIRRETVSTGTSVMILNNSEHKDAAWEYLKWWTSSDVQVQFGREMEGILGAAARYPSANKEAMQQLPWTVEEFNKLEEQWEWVRGIPEVPGGYMTGRHLDNAFRLVYNESANARETIYDYVQIINEEISKKRREFGLE